MTRRSPFRLRSVPTPPHGGLLTPREFIEQIAVRDYREALRNQYGIEDLAQLASLVEVAYEVSLRAVEGQLPRLVLQIGRVPEAELWGPMFIAIRRVPLNAASLARVASGMGARPYAVLVEREVEGYVVRGLRRSEYSDLSWVAKYPALYVQVHGPAFLSLNMPTVKGARWQYRAGRVSWFSDVSDLWSVQRPARQSVHDAAKAGSFGVAHREVDARRLSEARSAVVNLLTGALARAAAMGRGGTIALMPDRGCGALSGFEPGKGLEMEGWPLAAEALKYCPFRERSDRASADVMRLLEYAGAVARLSGIDGALVLDRDLRLVGAGHKIAAHQRAAPECRVAPPQQRLSPARRSWASLPPFDLSEHGTRHMSAARLASMVRGAVLLVVSQDGHTRSFEGLGESRVLVRGPAYASYGLSIHLP